MYLNTSHVKVKPEETQQITALQNNLNTSHVKVKLPKIKPYENNYHIFKYISC